MSLFRFSEETLEGLAVVDLLDLLDLLDGGLLKIGYITGKTYLPAIPEAIKVALILLLLLNDPADHLDKLNPFPWYDDLEGVDRIIEALSHISCIEFGLGKDQNEGFPESLET